MGIFFNQILSFQLENKYLDLVEYGFLLVKFRDLEFLKCCYCTDAFK